MPENDSPYPYFYERGYVNDRLFADVALSITSSCPATPITVDPVFSYEIEVSGGVEPYTFELLEGTLPAGTTLDEAAGIISGILTANGIFGWTVRVTDALAAVADLECTTTVNIPELIPLEITSVCPPSPEHGIGYSETIEISGGVLPYTVSITGTLPDGITFDEETATFSGTLEPGESGNFPYQIDVEDSDDPPNTDSLECEFDVAAEPDFEIVRGEIEIGPGNRGGWINEGNIVDGDANSYGHYILDRTTSVSAYRAAYIKNIPEPNPLRTLVSVEVFWDWGHEDNGADQVNQVVFQLDLFDHMPVGQNFGGELIFSSTMAALGGGDIARNTGSYEFTAAEWAGIGAHADVCLRMLVWSPQYLPNVFGPYWFPYPEWRFFDVYFKFTYAPL